MLVIFHTYSQSVGAGTQVNPVCIVTVDGITTSSTTAVLSSANTYTLRLTVQPTTSVNLVQSVELSLGDATPVNVNKLGRAVRDTSTNNSWTMPWYTKLTPSGANHISAFVNGITCNVTPFYYSIASTPTVTPLNVSSIPLSFTGYTNEAFNFSLKASVGATTGIDVSQYAIFEYLPQTLGSISAVTGLALNSNEFRFSAGPVVGVGAINVIAHYGGQHIPKSIPVTILTQPIISQATITNGGAATPSPTATPANSTISTASIAAASIEAEPAVKDCVTTKLTTARYLAISTGQSRPTSQEFLAFNNCFADRNHVLPSGFVPVAASDVASRPVSKSTSIVGAKTQTTKTGTTEKVSIKISGKALPNSIVLLYVFSEPLVLSATTDSNGDWSYSLEDPLQPGKHEAYAMVTQGDGSYARSSVFNFAIAKVEAAPTNPNGYSLQVQSVEASATENNRPLKVFVASIASLIFVVLGVMSFIIVRRRDKMHHQIALSSNAGTAPTNVIEPSSQVASTLAEQAPQPEIVQSPSSTLPSNSQSPAASLPQGQNNEIKP